MRRPHVGWLVAVSVAVWMCFATGAQAQSALANCKYYTKVQQDFEQGLPYCEQCIEDEPDNPEARFYGAWCLAEQGKWEGAWESFSWLIDRASSKDKNTRKHAKMASERVANYFATHFNTGVEYLNAGEEQFPAAEREFTIATTINPREANGFLNLGFTRNALGNVEGALSAFESAIEVAPDNATAYEYYSVALGSKRDSLLAQEDTDPQVIADVTAKLKDALERVVAAKPSNDAALLQLGDIALREGDQDKAFDYIKKAIDVDPNNVVKLYNIAVEFYQSKDYEAAARTFALVAEQEDDPDSDLWRDAKYNGALSLRGMGDIDGSLALVLELLEADAEQAEYHSLASQLYYKKNDLPKANEHMEKYQQLSAPAGGNQ